MQTPPGQQASFPFEVEAPTAAAPSLDAWAPQAWPVAPDWQPLTTAFFASPPGQQLGQRLQQRLAAGATIYPPQPLRALALTPLHAVRVVILGQDPYHGPGQAEGLAFSVAPGVRPPPSLQNIFKELEWEARQAGAAAPVPANGSLVRWAQQGVLLLNTCLTVEQGAPASHAQAGWEVLTQQLLRAVVARPAPVVFLLWGAHAQKMAALARPGHDLVLTANHPSPLSARRPPQPFIGCGHFAQANAFLQQQGLDPVQW